MDLFASGVVAASAIAALALLASFLRPLKNKDRASAKGARAYDTGPSVYEPDPIHSELMRGTDPDGSIRPEKRNWKEAWTRPSAKE